MEFFEDDESQGSAKSIVSADSQLLRQYGDVKAFTESEAKTPASFFDLLRNSADDRAALDVLQRRTSNAFYAHHKDLVHVEAVLPRHWVATFPHQATKAEIGQYNLKRTHYICTEHYDHGNQVEDSMFKDKPFVLWSIRDSSKHKACMIFCESARGKKYCPTNSNPCIAAPYWEVRGAGDKWETAVDGNANIIQVKKKGEQATKTGRLCVQMPGEHILHFYDKLLVNNNPLVKKMNPLYFN